MKVGFANIRPLYKSPAADPDKHGAGVANINRYRGIGQKRARGGLVFRAVVSARLGLTGNDLALSRVNMRLIAYECNTVFFKIKARLQIRGGLGLVGAHCVAFILDQGRLRYGAG